MVSFISKFLYFIDFSGFTLTFHIDRNQEYKTIFGGIISLIIFLLTFAAAGYFGKGFLDKSNPTVIVSVTEFTDVGPFAYNKDNFYAFYAFELANLTLYKNPRAVDFKANSLVITYGASGNQTVVSTDVEIDLCSKYFSVQDFPPETMAIIDINYYYCISPKVNNISILGYWGNGKTYTNLVVTASKCTNSTNNNNHCLPEEEINAIVNGGIFNVRPKNKMMKMNNITNPVQDFYDDIFYSLSDTISPSIFVNLKEMEFSSDTGFIFEDLLQIKSYYMESGGEHVLYYGSRGNVLANVTFQGKPLGQTVKRSYQKFQDILTKLGGLIKAIMLVSVLITTVVTKIIFLLDLLNQSLKEGNTDVKYIEGISPFQNNKILASNIPKLSNIQIEATSKIAVNKININKPENSLSVLNKKGSEDMESSNSLLTNIKNFFLVLLNCESKKIVKKTNILKNMIINVTSVESNIKHYFQNEYSYSVLSNEEKVKVFDFKNISLKLNT